jgi:hypothetical protein
MEGSVGDGQGVTPRCTGLTWTVQQKCHVGCNSCQGGWLVNVSLEDLMNFPDLG